jgi:hypothetical protein
MNDRGQYYSIAATTILFYDFLLTLPDEVSHAIGVSIRCAYCSPPQKIRYAWHGKKSWGTEGESLVVRHLLTVS